MKFAILITSAPYTSQASLSAYHFAKAVFEQKNEIAQVFFFQDGVYHANHLIYRPTDELPIIDLWQELSKEAQFELAVCSTSALLRGVIDSSLAQQYEKSAINFNPAFKMSSLTQMYEAISQSDRFITFGP